MEKEFLTPIEIANILKVNKLTVYRYIKSNKIKAYKIGNDLRIDKQDFEDFLESIKIK